MRQFHMCPKHGIEQCPSSSEEAVNHYCSHKYLILNTKREHPSWKSK